jgi:Mrp family chromosome partitioning ATPase
MNKKLALAFAGLLVFGSCVAFGQHEDTPPPLDVDRLIDDRRTRVIVCCGSGGVGKTTTAAAIGLRAAERGRHSIGSGLVITFGGARCGNSCALWPRDKAPRIC